MEAFNQSLFLILNASDHPATALVWLARLAAEYLIFLIPLTLLWGWFRGSLVHRQIMLMAALGGVVGLLCNQLIGLEWTHPRPFMLGVGHTLIPHAADSSFPSDHLTLLWSVAGVWLCHGPTRKLGMLWAGLGIPVAWARIYLGVHFPLDMLGALLVSGIATALCPTIDSRPAQYLYRHTTRLYHLVFNPLISRGWLAK